MTEALHGVDLTNFRSLNLTRRDLLKLAGGAALLATSLFGVDRLRSSLEPVPTPSSKSKKEVLGFLRGTQVQEFIPSVDSLDFSVLTTLAHFGLPLDGNNGELLRHSGEYQPISNPRGKLAQIIKRAQERKVRQLLTITLFDKENQSLVFNFLEKQNGAARKRAIAQITEEVTNPNVRYSGVSLDFEPAGNQASKLGRDHSYRFTDWVYQLAEALKAKDKNASLNICVNPQASREFMLWDLRELAKVADIAMMAYDFQPAKDAPNRYIMPTAPLHGFKEGEYWFDVSTAVEKFLEFVPRERFILLAPLYGVRAKVSSPAMKARVLDQMTAYTYAQAQEFFKKNQGKSNFISRWADYGTTEWYALQEAGDVWDMVVVGGPRMLEEWYKFVKDKNLKGIGFWALDQATLDKDFWKLLSQGLG